MWWWLTIASAIDCDADALTDALGPPAAQAAEVLGLDASAADALVQADVAALVARCGDRPFRERVQAHEVQPVAVTDRATLFLMAGHPSTWIADNPLDVGPATVWVPHALYLTRTPADASASLDLLGMDRFRVAVRPGLPVPPPEPPEDPRARREWEPPVPPFVEGSTSSPPVWTASCWGPPWAADLMRAVCGSIESLDAPPQTVALPSTTLAVTGPADPVVDHFRTLIWPDYGVTARMYVYGEPDLAQAHAEQSPMHAWVPGSETALVTCTADWPASQPVAQRICESLETATPQALEALRKLDRRGSAKALD